MYSPDGIFTEVYSKLRGVNIITEDKDIPELNSNDNTLESIRKGGIIHQMVRKKIQPLLRPGLKMSTLANVIESTTRSFTKDVGINKGIGFPTGLSINHCAAHYSPFKGSDYTLTEKDNVKIDFGVEVNGWIVDSAFTVSFDPTYDNLLKGVKDATYTGIKNAGIDVRIKEWGKEIGEVMSSYEVEVNGETKTVIPIKNLGGHNILKGHIHGGTFLPSTEISYYPEDAQFKSGVYAIETFGSTGGNWVDERPEENSLYSLKDIKINRIDSKSRKLAKKIIKRFKTLPFSDRYLEDIKDSRKTLKKLVESNIINHYPPLYEKNGEMTAQYEHTIYLSESGKKTIVSKGVDY